MPAGNRRSLGYRRYFTAIENDRVGIRRAVVESGRMFELLPTADTGPLHRLVSYPDWKRQALFALTVFLNYYQNQ